VRLLERCSTNSTYGEREKNASTGYIGGIEATNAEIMEHNGGKDAIKDMVTAAQEKGKASATHADNLRDRYGENLSVGYKGLSLADTMSAIDGSKLDSQAGQALGVLANKDKGVDVDYADNAMYGEMSKQQSTKAKLDAQGDVEEQAKILENSMKEGGASAAKSISEAAEKLAAVQTGMQYGGTAGLAKKFENGEEIYNALEKTGKFDEKSLSGLKN